MQDTAADLILKRNANRNFILNVLDGMAFIFGISLVSRFTVLPFFVARLSSDRWVQGLLPTLTQAGWVLPALFMAPLVASRPRRKPLADHLQRIADEARPHYDMLAKWKIT